MNREEGLDVSISPLAREALGHVVNIASGTATVEDARVLADWRARSSEHETAFREAVRLRQSLQSMLEARGEAAVVAFAGRRQVASRRAFLVGGGAMAASVAGAVLVSRPPFDLWPSYAEMMADYRTGIGERRTVTPLAGVSIEMNTRTSMSRGFGGSRIDLLAGEAFLAVAREDGFSAMAGPGTVLATDAKFNLRNIAGEVCVSCTAGELDVAHTNGRAKLHAGTQLVYTAARLGTVKAVSEAQATAWRSGLLIFRRERLSAVVAELNRYRGGRIVLTDRALAQRPVSAVFHLDQMANAVTQVEELVGVRGTRLPGGVVLIG